MEHHLIDQKPKFALPTDARVLEIGGAHEPVKTPTDVLDVLRLNQSELARSDAAILTFETTNESPLDLANTLENIVSYIRANSKARIVLAVSAKPTESLSIVANEYAKSTLLSAAVTIADKYDYVDYFPAYEIARRTSVPTQTFLVDRYFLN